MRYYPILVDLEGKTALVVGGGGVAERKVETLMDCGASIRVVSKTLTPKLKEWVSSARIEHGGDAFSTGNLEGVFLVIAATDDQALNHEISYKARERGLLINAVDQPSDCNFIVPSIVKRGDLLISISTSGQSPAMAKKLRKDLEGQFGEEYEVFLRLMGRLRKRILTMGMTQKENSRIFERIVHSDILKALSRGDTESAESTLRQILPGSLVIDDILNENPLSWGVP